MFVDYHSWAPEIAIYLRTYVSPFIAAAQTAYAHVPRWSSINKLAKLQPDSFGQPWFFNSIEVGLPMWKINLRISNNLYHAHEELTDA